MTTASPFRESTAPGRHFGLDWLRIGAFGLLIFYHVGMFFVTGSWLVKTAEPVEWLALPMLFLVPWRLALLFLVAGFASAALLGKLGGLGRFVTERSKRLLIPLGFAMAVIVPPQAWINLSFNHGYAGGFWHFWATDYFRFGPLAGVTLPSWEHLWFVAYLWGFTMALAAGLLLTPEAVKARIARAIESLGTGSRLLWMPLFYFVPVRAAVTFTLGESHHLFDDWLADLLYVPVFLFGFALARTPSLWPAIARLFRPALTLSLLSYAVLAALEMRHPEGITMSHEAMALDRAAMGAMLWSMMIVMLHLAATLLNRDHPWRARLSEAIFPVYIFHQTAIVVIGWWLLPLGLHPLAEFALILPGTLLGCALFYVAARSSPWLAPLAGLSAKRREPAGPLAMPPAAPA